MRSIETYGWRRHYARYPPGDFVLHYLVGKLCNLWGAKLDLKKICPWAFDKKGEEIKDVGAALAQMVENYHLANQGKGDDGA